MTTLDTWLAARRRPRVRFPIAYLATLVRDIRLGPTVRQVEGLDDYLRRDIGLEDEADIRRALREGRNL
jgi:hypothetical protein